MGIPTPRTAVERGRDIDLRLALLERRLLRGTPLPGRLSALGVEVFDWNTAIENGWYWSTGVAANNPVGTTASSIVNGQVSSYGPDGTYNRILQEVWYPSTTISNVRKTWRRVGSSNQDGTAWTFGDWTLIDPDVVPAHTHDASDVVSGRFAIARIPNIHANASNGRAYIGTDPVNPISNTSNFLAISPDSDTAAEPFRFFRNNSTVVLAIANDGEITGNARIQASRILGSLPWSQISGAPIVRGSSVDASAPPAAYPEGVTYAAAGSGFPASIGTVMTVRDSAYRQFQFFFDRASDATMYFRTSNGDAAWQPWRTVLTDASALDATKLTGTIDPARLPAGGGSTDAGSVSASSVPGNGGTSVVNVTFTAGKFSTAPKVVVSVRAKGTASAPTVPTAEAYAGAPTATGVAIVVKNNATLQSNQIIDWVASA